MTKIFQSRKLFLYMHQKKEKVNTTDITSH